MTIILLLTTSLLFRQHIGQHPLCPAPIRNIRNAATLLQGMARWVAPWQMWRSPGRAAPGGRGGRGAGQHRVAPAGAQVAPRRARQGSGITPLMERPSRAALAQPPPPRAQRLERTSSGSLAQAISEGSPPTGQPPHQPESRSATGDT